MSLKDYKRKRNFAKTREPTGRIARPAGKHRFVIQKHEASRLHYDFRLEIDGTLKSWAVPKGVPFKKGEKRLAVQVEDHPVDYIDFEGTIPKGQYGGGTVMVWDRGTFEAHHENVSASLGAGKLHFSLFGKKLRGDWYLVRLKDGKQWLLIKAGEDMPPVSQKQDDTSARSGKSMAKLARSNSVWNSKSDSGSGPPKTGKTRKQNLQLPRFVPPMLARPLTAVPRGDWEYELKFDGYRALILKGGDDVRLLSRNEKDLSERFPEILAAASELKAESALVDGEIAAVDEKGRPSFQLLQGYNAGGPRPPLLYYAFDLLELEGQDWKSRPLAERKSALEKLIPKKGILRFSGSLGSEGAHILSEVRKHGLEGLIGKRSGSLYEPGLRTGSWVKLRVNQEQEVVIGGYTEPEGGRIHFGALLVGVYQGNKLHFAGKVGTGFSDATLGTLKKAMRKFVQKECPFVNLPEKRAGRYSQGVTAAEMKRCHWVRPALVCQVRFFEWTSDNKMRHPVFLGLRDDKAAQDVVREIS